MTTSGFLGGLETLWSAFFFHTDEGGCSSSRSTTQQGLSAQALCVWEKLLPLQRKLHGLSSVSALLREVAGWGAAQVCVCVCERVCERVCMGARMFVGVWVGWGCWWRCTITYVGGWGYLFVDVHLCRWVG